MDMLVSFFAAFIAPWALASLIHYVDTTLSMVCFFAFTFAILVSFANPFVLFLETINEAVYFETNFRLSLKQMYDGDRLSRKETSILPKTIKQLESGGEQSLYSSQLPATSFNAHASTADTRTLLSKLTSSSNIAGMIKQRRYPTTQLLNKSMITKKRYESDDYSAASNQADSFAASDVLKSGASDSDASELLVASE